MDAAVLFPGDVSLKDWVFDRTNAESAIILKQEHRFIHYNRRSVAILKLTQVHLMPLVR